jgi:hypothetical protein
MPNGHPEEIKSLLFEEIAALRAEVAKLRKSEQTFISEMTKENKRLREAVAEIKRELFDLKINRALAVIDRLHLEEE